jgi:hypothetical protein
MHSSENSMIKKKFINVVMNIMIYQEMQKYKIVIFKLLFANVLYFPPILYIFICVDHYFFLEHVKSFITLRVSIFFANTLNLSSCFKVVWKRTHFFHNKKVKV